MDRQSRKRSRSRDRSSRRPSRSRRKRVEHYEEKRKQRSSRSKERRSKSRSRYSSARSRRSPERRLYRTSQRRESDEAQETPQRRTSVEMDIVRTAESNPNVFPEPLRNSTKIFSNSKERDVSELRELNINEKTAGPGHSRKDITSASPDEMYTNTASLEKVCLLTHDKETRSTKMTTNNLSHIDITVQEASEHTDLENSQVPFSKGTDLITPVQTGFTHEVTMEASSSDYSDEEVGVIARGQKLWVRGVRAHTTCADIVRALHDTPEAGGPLSDHGDWVLAERWRGVERQLPPDVPVLHVLAAWGDARHEVRLALRRVSNSGEDDSGRDSDAGSRGGRRRRERDRRSSTPPPRDPAARLVSVIQHQSRTIHQQLDKLREQEKLIDQLEDQTHKNRMEKHGTNYLLESYLRDLNRNCDVNDSQAGNSDSGVGVGSGTPPRRHTKHKSRRERHLMREHYFTKELTDICQVNSERLKQTQQTQSNDTDSDASSDELTRIREEIELLEKLAIINKRLHREEELVVRLTAKVKRYMDENKANSCENASQVGMLIDKIEEELSISTKELQSNNIELANAEREVQDRMKILDELTLQLEEEEIQNTILERQLNEASSRQPIILQDSYVPVLDQSSVPIPVLGFGNPGYVLDTLV